MLENSRPSAEIIRPRKYEKELIQKSSPPPLPSNAEALIVFQGFDCKWEERSMKHNVITSDTLLQHYPSSFIRQIL